MPQETKPLRPRRANLPRQPHRPQRRHHALADRRDAQHRIGRRDPEIAGEHDLQPAAEAIALDGGDGDGIEPLQIGDADLPGIEPVRGKSASRQLLHVQPATERPTLATHDHHIRLGMGREVFRCGDEILHPLPVRCVERLRAVQAEPS
jgi:hypothetical protein